MQVYDDVQQRERELMETKDRTTRNWSDVSNEIKNINSGNPCTYEVFESIVNKALADNVAMYYVLNSLRILRLLMLSLVTSVQLFDRLPMRFLVSLSTF